MFWAILIFANGTALLLFNQTLVGTLYNLTLPAPPLSAPVVYNNMTPVPAVLAGDVLTVPVLGHALITVKYVPRTRVVDGALAFNVTEGYYVIWAERGVLLLPTLQIINYTLDKNALVVIAKGPGTVAYTLQGTSPVPTATATTTTTPPAQTQQTTASPSTTSATETQQPPPAATSSTAQSPGPTA
ncbi:MAG: helix-turn-helix transcriptional regulator, partial [Pyrobaculum sp.]